MASRRKMTLVLRRSDAPAGDLQRGEAMSRARYLIVSYRKILARQTARQQLQRNVGEAEITDHRAGTTRGISMNNS
jgi:hypothetical protein